LCNSQKNRTTQEILVIGNLKHYIDNLRKKRNALKNLNTPFLDDIPEKLNNTLEGEKFLHYDNGADSISRVIIFTTKFLMEVLARAKIALADAIFKIAPTGFTQLLTVHCVFSKSG
jgi:hypothetical protein